MSLNPKNRRAGAGGRVGTAQRHRFAEEACCDRALLVRQPARRGASCGNDGGHVSQRRSVRCGGRSRTIVTGAAAAVFQNFVRAENTRQPAVAPSPAAALPVRVGAIRPEGIRPGAEFRIWSGEGSANGLGDLSYLLLPLADALSVGFLSCLPKWQEPRHIFAPHFFACGALPASVGCDVGCACGSLRCEFAERGRHGFASTTEERQLLSIRR